MRISDWSSDVCSSDLADRRLEGVGILLGRPANCLRSLAQGADHAVEIFRDILELRNAVEAGKGRAAGSSGADSAGLPLETAEIAPIAKEQRDHEIGRAHV